MAAVTHRDARAVTTNAATYASNAFTPGAGELLVVLVVAVTTVATPTMTNSAGLTMTLVFTGNVPTAADRLHVFISTDFAAASSQTVTFDCTGDNAAGTVIFVLGVSGMTQTGAAALRQASAGFTFGAAGIPETGAWSPATLTTNPTIVIAGNLSNPADLTPPVSWTEGSDTGFASPTTGAEYAFRDSGYASTTSVAWALISATAGVGYGFELDASAAVASQVPYRNPMTQLLSH